MALQMQRRCHFAFALLCSLSLLSPVLSIQCNETQYEWPVLNSMYCCNKCPPGTFMHVRFDHCQITCKPCQDEMYRDTYSVSQSCHFCASCRRPNMEYKSPCNATHNAVCRCKAGYECEDKFCKDCVPIRTTTKPTLPPSTTAMTPPKPLGDTVWFLVIIAILVVGTAVIVLTKIKPFLRWIKTKHDDILTGGFALTEDTDVSKPVQDTCGKCEQPLV